MKEKIQELRQLLNTLNVFQSENQGYAVTDLVYKTPSQSLREQADMIDARDRARMRLSELLNELGS